MNTPRDQVLHLIVGLVIGLLTGLVSPGHETAAAFSAGWAKERLYDFYRPATHTYDGWDAVATGTGGMLAQALMSLSRTIGWM